MGKLLNAVRFTAVMLFVSAGLLLVACSLPFTGWKALSVQTGSMEPNIPQGSLVFVHRVSPDSIKRGDVITYKSKSAAATITHRVQQTTVMHNGLSQIIVKGDANKQADAPVYDAQIVGKVTASAPYLGKVLDFIKKPIGLALLVYLPILLIFISEIRLLVRRLTQLELHKQMAAVQKKTAALVQPTPAAIPVSASATTSPGTIITPAEPSVEALQPAKSEAQPSTSKPKPRKRMIGRMGIVLMLPFLGFALTVPTFAQMTVDADLTGNTISTLAAPTPPTPEPGPKVILQQVDFPWAKTKRHRNVDPVAVYLYSTKRWKKMDISGWTISNTGGVLYTFEGTKATRREKGRQLQITLQRSQTLSVAGDFLVLKNAVGQIVDAISWGTDITQLNPSIQGIQAGDDIKRIRHTDTDSATDWRILP